MKDRKSKPKSCFEVGGGGGGGCQCDQMADFNQYLAIYNNKISFKFYQSRFKVLSKIR